MQATVKLLYVLTRVFAHICKEGFCRPQEEQDAANGEGGATDFQDDVEGTGMGAGQGVVRLQPWQQTTGRGAFSLGEEHMY